MTAIQRFALHGTIMNPHSSGPYVRHEDHLAAMQGGCLAQIEEPAQPVCWIRFCSDGSTEGPIMHSQICEARKTSGAWTPLYAGAAPAAVAGPAWDKTRDSLATLLLGLARRPFLDFDVACIALDAATESGMPLAYMRGAQAAPALEAPAAPAVPAGFALVPIEPTQEMLNAGRWSGAGSVSIQEEWARKEMWCRMLATITPPPAAYTDDLVALVENLAQAPAAPAEAQRLAKFLQGRRTHLGSCRESAGTYNQQAWDDYERAWTMLLGMAAPAAPSDPMEWPLPCDVTVGHITIRKGCALRTLALRMQVLYDLSQKVELAAPAVPDPRTAADMHVNGGALKLALNVLRRAGKNEVADELEKTAAPAAPAVDASDTALLDAMERHRIAVVPEHEGPWDAELYEEGEEPQHIGSGATPREALRAAIAAKAKEGGAA